MTTNNEIITTLSNGVREIIFNRPSKKNAFNEYYYTTLIKILNEDASNDNVVITIFTGNGDYFSSGNDLTSGSTSENPLEVFEQLVNAFINYPKILVAVLNGPAVGIGATMLGLCDIVYFSEKAYIYIPFVSLGISMEGCSSYIFPQLLGKSKFSEMLYFNNKLTAEEALHLGFTTKIIPQKDIKEFIKSLHKYGSLPVQTVIRNKHLFKKHSGNLKEINRVEVEALTESFNSPEFANALLKMMERKTKSKL